MRYIDCLTWIQFTKSKNFGPGQPAPEHGSLFYRFQLKFQFFSHINSFYCLQKISIWSGSKFCDFQVLLGMELF